MRARSSLERSRVRKWDTIKKHKKIYVISESQDTCVVYGMPRSIEQQGLSDKVVPINQVADAIIKKLGD